MRCLVVSPVPTEPAWQGNAVNIARLNRRLQEQGYAVHFVYSAMEGANPHDVSTMMRDWDWLDVIPYPGIKETSGPRGYSLDAWFDPAVGRHVEALCDAVQFDLVLVHYVWMSGVLDYIPPATPSIIFTHDRFGDRHAMLARAGIAPTWYSITPEDEARGLSRADAVIAVQESEAAHFRTCMSRPVYVVGSLLTLHNRPRRLATDVGREPLVAGYIGSANPSNRQSMIEFIRAVDATPALCGGAFRLNLAGPISDALEAFAEREWIERLGVVENPESVFESVDLIVNPSVGGSGLKIKTVEALAAGMPVVGTVDAMAGLPVSHPAHCCAGPESMARLLTTLLRKHELEALCVASRAVAEAYMCEQAAEFGRLLRDMRRARAVPASLS